MIELPLNTRKPLGQLLFDAGDALIHGSKTVSHPLIGCREALSDRSKAVRHTFVEAAKAVRHLLLQPVVRELDVLALFNEVIADLVEPHVDCAEPLADALQLDHGLPAFFSK